MRNSLFYPSRHSPGPDLRTGCVSRLLYRVSSIDPLTLTSVFLALVVAALFASYISSGAPQSWIPPPPSKTIERMPGEGNHDVSEYAAGEGQADISFRVMQTVMLPIRRVKVSHV